MPNQIKITRNGTLNIVTSGYSDRFIRLTTNYTVEMYTSKGVSVTAKFDDKSEMIDFLCHIKGYTFENAYKIPIEEKNYVSGYLDNILHHWSHYPLSKDDVYSIEAYLVTKVHLGKYTDDHTERMTKQLADHPLSDNLQKIIQYQLSECDRVNTARWGHPNGQFGTGG